MRERGGMTGWGLWSPVCARGGRFGARNQKSRGTGAILVGPGDNPQLTIAGGCGMRERGQLRAWGTRSPRCMGGAGLAGETDNRAARARYRWELEKTPR